MRKNFVLPALATVVAAALVFTGCKREHESVKVGGITVAPATVTLEIDGTATLTATVTPADADNTSYTWSSSAEAVATVSTSGVVTAKSAGTATITATANDGSNVKGTATITVSPDPVSVITAAEGLSLTAVNELKYSEIVDAEGKPVKDLSVEVASPGIGKITLKLTTDAAPINDALTEMELTDGFELGALSAEVAETLATFFGEGLPTGDAVVGKDKVKLDFSAIQPLIAGLKGGVNQFDIEIKAEDEDSEVASATQTLKLKFVDDVTVWGTIAGDGFDIAEEQVVKRSQIAEAPQMKINITSLDGIENFLVDINGATIDGALQAVGLAGEFDLANPDEALATSLAGLAAMDIVLPSGDAIKGKKELAFDLTSFIPMIAALGEGSVSFKITVKDAAGHAVSETLTVTIDDDLTLSIASDAIGEEPLEILKSVATGETPTPVVVDIVADQGIANLTVKIESSSDYFMAIFGEATGIPAEFDLANAPEALAEKLAEIGLIDSENPVKDATEVQFDITDFIPMIFTAMAGDPDADPALPAEEECTADFTVTVKDGANQTKTATVALSLKDDSTEE